MPLPDPDIWVSRKGTWHVAYYLTELLALYKEYYWSLLSIPAELHKPGQYDEATKVSYLVDALSHALEKLEEV